MQFQNPLEGNPGELADGTVIGIVGNVPVLNVPGTTLSTVQSDQAGTTAILTPFPFTFDQALEPYWRSITVLVADPSLDLTILEFIVLGTTTGIPYASGTATQVAAGWRFTVNIYPAVDSTLQITLSGSGTIAAQHIYVSGDLGPFVAITDGSGRLEIVAAAPASGGLLQAVNLAIGAGTTVAFGGTGPMLVRGGSLSVIVQAVTLAGTGLVVGTLAVTGFANTAALGFVMVPLIAGQSANVDLDIPPDGFLVPDNPPNCLTLSAAYVGGPTAITGRLEALVMT
jgi:hypothetical protein